MTGGLPGGSAVLVTHPSASLYGSDRMLVEAVRGMVAAGLRPVLAVPERGPLVQAVEQLGVPVVVCSSPVLRRSGLSVRGMARLLLRAAADAVRGSALLRRTRPSAVYVSTITTPLWVLLARLHRVPVLVHVHEAEGHAPRLLQQVMALPLLAATGVVVNSRFTQEVLARSFPSLRQRSTVVLNGVEGPAVPVARPAAAQRPVRLLYVGRLSERKGPHVALEAVELLVRQGVDVRLDLVGDAHVDNAAYAERLRERARPLEHDGVVTFHGFAGDVWPALAGCDVLLVPATQPESFGNTAVEGVLAGRPVIASDLGGLPEALAGYAGARVVPAGDAAALADAVRSVVADLPALTAAAGQDAVAAAARHRPAAYQGAVADAVLALSR